MTGKLLAGALLIAGSLSGSADERIRLRASPAVALAPANLTIRAVVDRHPANRSVTVAAESPGFYRSSEVTLDGERAPRVTVVQFRGLPSGEYAVRAVIRGDRGQELAASETSVRVLDGGEP